MTRKVLWLEVVLILAAVAATLAVYPQLPGVIPTHWNAQMKVDGHGPKWMLFLLGPGVMAFLALLTAAAPWLSPQKFAVDSFRSTYDQAMLIVFCAMTFGFAVALYAATGHKVNAGRTIEAGVCLLLLLLGNLLGKVRRNFFLGVRTPWTLASERVWNATHRFAAKTFVVGSLMALALVICNVCGVAYVLGAAVLAPVVYSLLVYKRWEKAGEL